MTFLDPSIQAAYVSAIRRLGITVTFQRVVGTAPNATISPAGGASVQAIVRNMLQDSTAAAEAGYATGNVGALGQADRMVIVMASDLAAAGFPLPLQCGDQVLLPADMGGEILSIERPDIAKRAIAGAIECSAAGIG